ncbi:hypothetical protein BIW11_07529 [Tropilaelaps mercedesae]|uniref:Uncharacterized protein n=1 Tax=Tropilaelaps mercedesae TaxID=418985 RepID=A0A1V9XTX4_9ACAR|nr:hypothetical protein BIW11_07529 [Tropilaelaps mercedesae]
MLIKFAVEPNFACAYYFSHIDLYIQAGHEIDPTDFDEIRDANSEFFACLASLADGSIEVFNEVRSSSTNKERFIRKTRFSTPLD